MRTICMNVCCMYASVSIDLHICSRLDCSFHQYWIWWISRTLIKTHSERCEQENKMCVQIRQSVVVSTASPSSAAARKNVIFQDFGIRLTHGISISFRTDILFRSENPLCRIQTCFIQPLVCSTAIIDDMICNCDGFDFDQWHRRACSHYTVEFVFFFHNKTRSGQILCRHQKDFRINWRTSIWFSVHEEKIHRPRKKNDGKKVVRMLRSIEARRTVLS